MKDRLNPFNLREEIRGVAEGKIRCHCGNGNWEQFLYVSVGTEYMAGCKLCATAHTYLDGEWKELARPEE